jgi:hypothetical protein
MDIDTHNKIIDEVIKLGENQKKYTYDEKKEIIDGILKRYNIDITFSDNSILCIVVSYNDYDSAKICLDLGANPHDIMNNRIIKYDMKLKHKIGMDTLFKSKGYICEWIGEKFWRPDDVKNEIAPDEIEEPKRLFFQLYDQVNEKPVGSPVESTSRSEAATKIYYRILNKNSGENTYRDKYDFCIRERTRGCNRGKYFFQGSIIDKRVSVDEKEEANNGLSMNFNIRFELNPSKSTPCKNIVKVTNDGKVKEYELNCVKLRKYHPLIGDHIDELCCQCCYCT